MNVKTLKSAATFIILILAIALLALHITSQCHYLTYHEDITTLEKIAVFLLLEILLVRAFRPVTDKGLKKPLTWIINVLSAAFITAAAIFANSAWHLLNYYNMFDGEYGNTYEEYLYFLNEDLNYSIGLLAPLRYVGIFLMYFVVFFASHFREKLFIGPYKRIKKRTDEAFYTDPRQAVLDKKKLSFVGDENEYIVRFTFMDRKSDTLYIACTYKNDEGDDEFRAFICGARENRELYYTLVNDEREIERLKHIYQNM